MNDDISKVDNPWRKFIENCINGDNYFRGSEYRELLADLDRGYQAEAQVATLARQLAEARVLLATRVEASRLDDAMSQLAEATRRLGEVEGDAARGVVDEDIRWCEDIAASLQEAGGPTNNMRLIALRRVVESVQAAALPAATTQGDTP